MMALIIDVTYNNTLYNNAPYRDYSHINNSYSVDDTYDTNMSFTESTTADTHPDVYNMS